MRDTVRYVMHRRHVKEVRLAPTGKQRTSQKEMRPPCLLQITLILLSFSLLFSSSSAPLLFLRLPPFTCPFTLLPRCLRLCWMSFDRVLPKPPGLHHEPSRGPAPRKTSSLFEHKIMNDAAARVPMEQHPDDGPAASSCRYAADTRSAGVPLNRAKVALNKIACTASPADGSNPMAPSLTRDGLVRDRSSSSSPVKSAAGKEPAQFCLCQPDPKIPRPRNGEQIRPGCITTSLTFPAFILYRQHYQSSVVAKNPRLPNPEISKIIGEHWRTLPEDTKQEWKALAEVFQWSCPLPLDGNSNALTGRESSPSAAVSRLPISAPSIWPGWPCPRRQCRHRPELFRLDGL